MLRHQGSAPNPEKISSKSNWGYGGRILTDTPSERSEPSVLVRENHAFPERQ